MTNNNQPKKNIVIYYFICIKHYNLKNQYLFKNIIVVMVVFFFSLSKLPSSIGFCTSVVGLVINRVLVTRVCPKLRFYSDSDSDNSEGHRKGSESVYFRNSGFRKYSDEIPTFLEGRRNSEGATKTSSTITSGTMLTEGRFLSMLSTPRISQLIC